MNKKTIMLLALIGVSTMLAVCASNNNGNSPVGQSVNYTSESDESKKNVGKTLEPNMVAIFEGEKVQKFPFVWYTITGEKGQEKIVFNKLKVVYEKGMACFTIGSTTDEYNLNDCVFYYSESELALAEGAYNETLPDQTLVDGANNEVLLRELA